MTGTAIYAGGGQLTTTAKPRIEWIDVARGLGIILVVFGHVIRGLIGAGLLPPSNPVWLSDYAIYTFHMPLFFVLAGLNVEGSLARGKKAFFFSKLWTIAYPYLLWSVIEGGLQVLLPSFVNHQRSPLFLLSILWRPIAQFWFLYSLFLCHMAALAIGRRKTLFALLGLVSLALSLYGLGTPTTHVFPFYVLGIFVGPLLKAWSPRRSALVAQFAGCALLFAILEHFGRLLSGSDAAAGYSLPAALCGIAGMCILSQLAVTSSRAMTMGLTALGAMSMTIYILHPLFCVAIRGILLRVHEKSLWVHAIAGTLAGIVLPAILHLAFTRLRLLSALGLAPLPRRDSRKSLEQQNQLATARGPLDR